MPVEVTLGTGMSCISSGGRGDDNGSDNEDNLNGGQQGRTPPRLSVPCVNRVIQTDMHARLPLLAEASIRCCLQLGLSGSRQSALKTTLLTQTGPGRRTVQSIIQRWRKDVCTAQASEKSSLG